jgi:hypothetical protein
VCGGKGFVVFVFCFCFAFVFVFGFGAVGFRVIFLLEKRGFRPRTNQA